MFEKYHIQIIPRLFNKRTRRRNPLMMFPSVRYASLAQNEEDIDSTERKLDEDVHIFEYGMPPGTFDSAFTYANYNDLDKMGYEAPKR